MSQIPRRAFLKHMVSGAGTVCVGPALLADAETQGSSPIVGSVPSPHPSPGGRGGFINYQGPNVIVVRFGCGVRRRETIQADHTYSPYLIHELTKRGTLFKNMEISNLEGIETSHGQGTLYTLTGKYDRYEDVEGKALAERFEAKVPTVFEYLRKAYNIPAHQTVIVNGEDRTDEEFYTFSNHHLFGVKYGSNVLSLYRFKTYLLRKQLASGRWSGKELEKRQNELKDLESLDYRRANENGQGPEIEAFWERWRQYYGESGMVNPRGDRLLTELSIRAIRQLRPRLLMINYQDPDYVHWGNLTHYTRGISIIDEGIQRLVTVVDADAEYRDNTVFVIVPDCGRDDNRFMSVPCQHHFNTKSAHEIWCIMFGPGIARGQVVDKTVDQISVAATVGKIMGFKAEFAEGSVLTEAFA